MKVPLTIKLQYSLQTKGIEDLPSTVTLPSVPRQGDFISFDREEVSDFFQNNRLFFVQNVVWREDGIILVVRE